MAAKPSIDYGFIWFYLFFLPWMFVLLLLFKIVNTHFLGNQYHFSDRLIENPFEENGNGQNNNFPYWNEIKHDAIITSWWKNELHTRFAYSLIQLDEWNIAWYNNNNDTEPLRLFYYLRLVQHVFSILNSRSVLSLFFRSVVLNIKHKQYSWFFYQTTFHKFCFISFAFFLFLFDFISVGYLLLFFFTHCASSVSPALQSSTQSSVEIVILFCLIWGAVGNRAANQIIQNGKKGTEKTYFECRISKNWALYSVILNHE